MPTVWLTEDRWSLEALRFPTLRDSPDTATETRFSHAIIDALLGAAGLGDIGSHFPSTDPSLAGISSLILLAHTARLIAADDWCISNVDATMLAQRPRLSPYLGAMRRRIAHALMIEQHLVSVKATTTDHLGFTGREEGMAAMAVALLSRG